MARKRVVVTGAAGNIGSELMKELYRSNHMLDIVAAVKQPADFPLGKEYTAVTFNSLQPASFPAALQGCNILFLLRPPQITSAKKVFAPLIAAAANAGVSHIVFLSVQGAGDNKFIPHYKIEQLLKTSGIPYTFLRPAYFMQNFTTTLYKELKTNKRVFLPAGKQPFTIIDVKDIARVAAQVILHPSAHINAAYDLTNYEQLNFGQMTKMLAEATGLPIRYKSPNLIHFIIHQRKMKMPMMMVLVMIMLHYLPRFKKTPQVSSHVEDITGRTPVSFAQFAAQVKLAAIKTKVYSNF